MEKTTWGDRLPNPFRDVLYGPLDRRELEDWECSEKAKNMIKSSIRIALAVAGAYYIAKNNNPLLSTSIISGCLSLPSTLIAGGGYLGYLAYLQGRVALTTGSLMATGKAIGAFVASYLALNFNRSWFFLEGPIGKKNFCEIGLLERFVIRPLAKELKPWAKTLFNES